MYALQAKKTVKYQITQTFYKKLLRRKQCPISIAEIKELVIKSSDVCLNPEDEKDLFIFFQFKQLINKFDPDDAYLLLIKKKNKHDQAGESSIGARAGSATTPHVNSVNHTMVSRPSQSKRIVG
ncbi:uncharacterized protein LOC129911482 isoform X1 [Episyrphus balteatus]|uniref:uncharacterized protein LOC129911352 isoform X1 n=1 Tax=Episyrphus balteatus TaxID=286459 RepID=UPI0024854FE5|nr:uncharacterized protein LOC129911352 isoform X1 [Episyrphus balteatus]XP_055845271.1 uncharacterized protein LOC129911482 isoform X1 [Episyrphus balteatus]